MAHHSLNSSKGVESIESSGGSGIKPAGMKRGSLPLTYSNSGNKYANSAGKDNELRNPASHNQQRRLSERGLMIYRPNKPDIDLIKEFSHNNQQMQHGGISGGTSGLKFVSMHQQQRRNSSIPAFQTAAPNIANNNLFEGFRGNSSGNQNENQRRRRRASSTMLLNTAEGGDCANKVVQIRINPIHPEFYSPLPFNNKACSNNLLDDPGAMGGESILRRFSDSSAIPRITPTELKKWQKRRSSANAAGNSAAGIVCSTGELLSLKCLTSSAQEIRCCGGDTGNDKPGSTCLHDKPGNLQGGVHVQEDDKLLQQGGARSRSLDACQKKSSSNSWFSRRHLPISAKIDGAAGYSGSNKVNTPILTVTAENDVQSELILDEIPSPPAATPNSRSSGALTPSAKICQPAVDDGQTTDEDGLSWMDKKNKGYVLDALVLGLAIENHLKKGDGGGQNKRRATFSTLYYPPHQASVQSKVTIPSSAAGSGRPRSGSSYAVVPILGSSWENESGRPRRESICTSSLQTSSKAVESPESSDEELLSEYKPTTQTHSTFIRTNVTSDFGEDEIINEENENEEEEVLLQPDNIGNISAKIKSAKVGEADLEGGSRRFKTRRQSRGDSICQTVREFFVVHFLQRFGS